MSELINNREKRIETLKEIITGLNQGVDPESVKERLKGVVRQTTGSEIVAMEESLIADGMTPQEVKGMCDLHSQVLRELVGEKLAPQTEPGHPVHTFRRENGAMRELVRSLRDRAKDLTADDPFQEAGGGMQAWRQAARDLQELEKHYSRKENLLFPYLEKHGIQGPSQVMWAKDDDIRQMVKAFQEAVETEGLTLEEWRGSAAAMVEPVAAAVEEMIYKEENILFPMAMDTLTEEEWGEIYRQTPRIGYCIVEPEGGYSPPDAKPAEHSGALPPGGAVLFPSGALTEEQLLGIFSALPVDTTFVDADDRVAFFSEGPDRVFARTKSVIGRKVQNCHPPASVDVVDRILRDFRSGEEDVAEFWINLHGRFVHIRYFAVRDRKKRYLGTLEVTQDLTRLRALEGDRRLLQYEER